MDTTLITGANRGIGLEFARQYAADGWRVLACTRHPQKSAALNTLAAEYPGQITVHALDVADHAQIEKLARSLTDESIDLLLNNAGIYTSCHKDDNIDQEAWIRAFLINTIAPLKMAQAFAPQIDCGSRKTIVAISSKMGSIADNSGGGSYIYRSSKAAVNMVIKSLAIDLKPAGIIAVVLHPGWVKTDMGGPNALISATKSVSGMRNVIRNLTLADSGRFIAYDGQMVPW
ncbi:short-chain dehydrogenase [Nitrosospira lacus]|uniref:Short-chain dehydrogenase n=1 Tax=Nitrosospira lacus TaxID=1288494 RepID=A0A1W6SNG5_9PROT|nr:SDR family oxidoreductase [Nitrosospira lacus]ARO87337.1 short-chain dehydrogenase [Nitrosospira lacus]